MKEGDRATVSKYKVSQPRKPHYMLRPVLSVLAPPGSAVPHPGIHIHITTDLCINSEEMNLYHGVTQITDQFFCLFVLLMHYIRNPK